MKNLVWRRPETSATLFLILYRGDVFLHSSLHAAYAEDYAFQHCNGNDGGKDTEKDVYDVVMGGIYCGPPDAHADESEDADCEKMLTTLHGIDGGDEHVGGVQRRHGCEHVGVVAVDGVKDGETDERVEAVESCHVARSVENWLKTIMDGIPWWGSGMDVITHETHEVDKQEGYGEAEICLALAFQIKIDGESQRHGHPTKIEEACHKVGKGTVMDAEPFAWNESARGCGDAEEGTFCLEKPTYVYRAKLIIGEESHRVVADGERQPRRQSQCYLACGAHGEKHQPENNEVNAEHCDVVLKEKKITTRLCHACRARGSNGPHARKR